MRHALPSTHGSCRAGRPRLISLAGIAMIAFVLSFWVPVGALAQSGDDAAATAVAPVELSIGDAAVLGLVEGLTEYLPVSSTGHLLVATEILGIGDDSDQTAEQRTATENALDTYAICIQSGAILAVLILYKKRIWQMVDGLIGRSAEGRRVLIAVVAAFVPTAIIAASLFDTIRERVFGSVGWIAAAWIVGGLVILYLSRSGFFKRTGHGLAELTVKQAVVIGLLQAIAIWPGVSRSLVTMIAGVLVGMNLRASVEFSFLLGLVTLSAATAYEGTKGGPELIDTFGYTAPLVGLVVAFISAVLAVKWMVDWIQQRGFELFGWYRLGIGTAAFAAIGLGWL